MKTHKRIFIIGLLGIFCFVSCQNQKKKEETATSPSKQVEADTTMVKLLFPSGKDILTGGDGAISIPIDENKSFFLWGDSFLGEVKDNKRDTTDQLIVGNVWTLLDGIHVKTICGGTPQKPTSVLSIGTVNGHMAFLWPMHGMVKDSIVHVFMSTIVRTGQEIWDFYWHSSWYYRLHYPDLSVIDSLELQAPFKNHVHYGYGITEHDGYYYIYGTAPEKLEAPLHAARTKLVDGKLQNWEYFDGTGWSTDAQATKAMQGIDIPVSEQFSIFKHGEKFILLTHERGIRTNDIYTFVSDKPEGPWYNKKKVYTITDTDKDPNLWAYSAMAHPQYDKDDALLVSYCINTHDIPDLFSDATIYKPRFIRVPYSIILEK